MTMKLLRRIHLYAGLFLAPWVLMYALSTIVMNHRALFRDKPGTVPQWQQRSEHSFQGAFPADASAQLQARTILAWLGMEGAFNARVNQQSGALTIQRQRLVDPVRITFRPSDNRVVVEGQPAKTPALLERLHRRRGYEQNQAADDIWAFIVDAFILTLLFWVISGFILWWQIKATRKLGLAFALGGAAIFAFYAALL
jgi:hypothetical protein